MPLTEKHRKQIIIAYCLVFYLLMVYKLWNGFLLFQLKPFLFTTRFDLFTWLLMQTGLHRWLLNNPPGWMIFDCSFYAMPCMYFLAYKKNARLAAIAATIMLLVNWTYIQCYTLYPANSIESFTAWLLFPVLFIAVNLRSFYFILHGLRYFFLFFFVSAAAWKFVQGGIFNAEQMTAVLLFQHKEYLVTSQSNWYTSFIYWLINHSGVSYVLYLSATIFEMLFVTGFFTKKYDHFLIAVFVLFLLADILIMRIPYWEVSAFMITLAYSKYSLPPNELTSV